ncbi:MAG: HAD family hydrolase [Gemmatimonadota bacterium]
MTPRPPWLLASDMDGTVIPLDQAPERPREIQAFGQAVRDAPSLVLAYITGRSLSLAVEGVDAFDLPWPEFLAADVGTRIYHRTEEDWEVDPDYDARMVEAAGGVELEEVVGALASMAGLRVQPPVGQGRFKRSYFFDREIPPEDLVGAVGERLRSEGARVNLVWSRDPVAKVGLLDVLPHGIDKAVAVRYLRERAGTEPHRVAYAGDSGNDRAAFLGGFAGIVVGNAPAGLKAHLREADGAHRLYFSEAPFAAGVLEGLLHYGVI